MLSWLHNKLQLRLNIYGLLEKIEVVVTHLLRDYQVDLIAQIEAAIAQGHRRIMLQLPTGAGKTRCFVELAKNHRFNPYAGGVPNCLVIAHREELIVQAADALERELRNTIIGVGIIKAGYKPLPRRSIQVATIQTLIRRKFPPAGLVIIDEAHHAAAETYQRVIEHYGEAIILGVTATPIRADGKGFKDTFDILIKGASIRELTSKKFLCPYRLFAYPIQRINIQNMSTVAGDFDLDELADAVVASEVRADLVKTWEQYADGMRTVVFAVNTKLSKEYAEAYCKAGHRAEHIDGKMLKGERAAILDRFKQGETQILCNCNIVTEGFDLPEMECVQVVRPTQSLSFWMQMVGRSLRIANDKTEAIILDHTDNYSRLELPDAERNWTLDGIDHDLPEPTEEGEGTGDRKREPEHREGELIEVYSNLLINTEVTPIIPLPVKKDTGSNLTETEITSEITKIPQIVKDTDSNFTEDIEGGIELEMITIYGGIFSMGSNDGNSYEKPIHQVTVPAFSLGKYPITQEQYQAVIGKNPSGFKGAKLPVERVSWNDAMNFCQKLSQKTGKKYRLPSEAEWEYACRGGTQTKYCFGDDKSRLKDYAWCRDNSDSKTHPVGEKKPNAFGLYDMHGNVWEWCSDRWHDNYTHAPTDGSLWETNTGSNYRVLRGGSWVNDTRSCCAANRSRSIAEGNNDNYSVRVACVSVLPMTL